MLLEARANLGRLTPVALRDKWGVVDDELAVVVELEYKAINRRCNDFFICRGFDGIDHVFDTAGQKVFEHTARDSAQRVGGFYRLDSGWAAHISGEYLNEIWVFGADLRRTKTLPGSNVVVLEKTTGARYRIDLYCDGGSTIRTFYDSQFNETDEPEQAPLPSPFRVESHGRQHGVFVANKELAGSSFDDVHIRGPLVWVVTGKAKQRRWGAFSADGEQPLAIEHTLCEFFAQSAIVGAVGNVGLVDSAGAWVINPEAPRMVADF